MRSFLGATLAVALFAVPAAAQIQVVGAIPVSVPALAGTVTSIDANPGTLTAWYCVNTTAAVAYVQIFDAATPGAVTLGTAPPRLSLPLAANQSFGGPLGNQGVAFFVGIQAAATTTPTGSTGAAVSCNFGVAR